MLILHPLVSCNNHELAIYCSALLDAKNALTNLVRPLYTVRFKTLENSIQEPAAPFSLFYLIFDMGKNLKK